MTENGYCLYFNKATFKAVNTALPIISLGEDLQTRRYADMMTCIFFVRLMRENRVIHFLPETAM